MGIIIFERNVKEGVFFVYKFPRDSDFLKGSFVIGEFHLQSMCLKSSENESF